MSGKAPIAVISYGKFLKPADAWSAEQMDALPRNKRLNAKITEQRSVGASGWYWAGLGLLLDNLSDEDTKLWPTSRKLHEMILEDQGYMTKLYRADGTFSLIPDSIAFDNMDEEEFRVLFEKARAFVFKKWGYDPWDLWMQEKEAQNAMGKSR